MILKNNILTRSNLIDLIKPLSVGCELGVFLCEYSDVLIQSGKFNKFYLVDTFNGTVGSGDAEGENIRIFNGNDLFEFAKQKYANNQIASIVKTDSVSFLKSKPDKYFDFIYIDTVHTYDHLLSELEESLRVIKDGGLLCGHDYNKEIFPGVVNAVIDFTKKYNLSYYTTSQEKLNSFIIQI